MSAHFDQLKYLFGVSGLVSIYGIASMVVWFVGPSVGLGATERIALIALVLLTWPAAVLIGHYRRRRQERLAVAGAGAAGVTPRDVAPAAAKPAPRAPRSDLAQSAEEAVQWLRSTRLASQPRGDGDAVYSLPWFLVVGPPSSGKTSLLLDSGLDFHALPSQRRHRETSAGPRPTRGAEWRVTDQAVLLDTAGDYHSNLDDNSEWTELVETLKAHRRRRPADGVVLAVSAAAVLGASDAEVEHEAKALRARIDELAERSGARFPVYVVFTHADAIEGFDDFFASLSPEERAEAWGATIPLDSSDDAHTRFGAEYDLLVEALSRRRLARLAETDSPAEQLRVFEFPLRFAGAKRKLEGFTTALFRPNPFSESPLMRGFYFTRSEEGLETQGWFVEGLFSDVLLPDKDLAASIAAARGETHRVRDALLAVAASLLAMFAIGLVVSFASNRNLIAEARSRGEGVRRIQRPEVGTDLTSKSAPVAGEELLAVDALRQTLVDLADPPLYRRFGLYVGGTLEQRLLLLYNDAVFPRFVKPLKSELESDLRAFVEAPAAAGAEGAAAPNAEGASEDLSSYDRLRAYLMFSDRWDKADAGFLRAQLDPYWARLTPDDPRVRELADTQRDFYVERVVGRPDMQHVVASDELVGKTREKLATYSVERIFLKRVTAEISDKVNPVTIDSVGGRHGGWLTGAHAVPGAFTLDGYREMKERLESVPEDIQKDDWVMASATAAKGQTADVEKLRSLYLAQYVDHWIRYLRGVHVAKFESRAAAGSALSALGAVNSPLETVVRATAENTRPDAATSGWSIFAWFKGKKKMGPVDERFAPLAAFLAAEGKDGMSPLSKYQLALQQLGDAVERTPDDRWEETTRSLLQGKDALNFKAAEGEVARSLDPLKASAVSDAAALLRQPLDNFRGLLRGDLDDQVVRSWGEIYSQARSLEAGFPFDPAASSKTSVRAIEEFLNPVDGQFTRFFDEKLKGSFEDVQGEWKPKEPGKFSDEFVAYLNRARRLRDALFPGNSPTVKVSGDLALSRKAGEAGAGADASVEVDGVRVESRGAPSAKFAWPAAQGSSGARVRAYPAQGGAPADITFPGEWGLYDMFVRGGGPSAKTGTNQYALGWTVGGSRVRATLTPSAGASDPFDLGLFKLRAPQSPTGEPAPVSTIGEGKQQ